MGALFLQNLISHIMMMDLGFIFTFLPANFSAVDFFFFFLHFSAVLSGNHFYIVTLMSIMLFS